MALPTGFLRQLAVQLRKTEVYGSSKQAKVKVSPVKALS